MSFNNQGVRAPNLQRVYQFRNITLGEFDHIRLEIQRLIFISCAENGAVELNWYEVGRVINNGTDFVYVGDFDIWPGKYADIIIQVPSCC